VVLLLYDILLLGIAHQISKVWGIGEKTAEKLVKMGFTSVTLLRETGQHVSIFEMIPTVV
jgi:hypothetical protein